MILPNQGTGYLGKTLPRYPLSNSDNIQRSAGIWRHSPGGIIEPAYFEYATNTIGPYRVPDRYGYVQEYYTKRPTPPTYLLYRALVESKTGLAAYYANNSHVCLVMPDSLKYTSIDTGEAAVFSTGDERIEGEIMVNIGWVKTYSMCQEVAMPPHQLQLSATRVAAYMGGGQWTDVLSNAKLEQPEFGAYKQLLKQADARAVYVDCYTNELKYIP